MRFNPYDDVFHQSLAASSVAIQSLTGSSAVKLAGVDTQVAHPLESIMFHLRAEIASGTPDASTVAWKLQESVDDVDGDYTDALDNTGTLIGATLNVHTVAADSYARIEGVALNRKRWLRIVLTPAFTGGSSPAILTYGEFIGAPGSGANLPVRTAVSNT